MCTIAAKYRLLFEFFSTIRTFHLRLPAYFLIAACYERNYEYCHRRAVRACTITHITAETVRYGGGMALRFLLRMKSKGSGRRHSRLIADMYQKRTFSIHVG